MEAGDFRWPPVVNKIGFQLRFYGKKRVLVMQLHLFRKILPDLPQHLPVVARRRGRAAVAVGGKVGPTQRVALLAIEAGQVVVAHLVVGVRH